MIDETQMDLTATQVSAARDLAQMKLDRDMALDELRRLRSWIAEIRDLALSGALVAPAAVIARVLDDGLRGDL